MPIRFVSAPLHRSSLGVFLTGVALCLLLLVVVPGPNPEAAFGIWSYVQAMAAALLLAFLLALSILFVLRPEARRRMAFRLAAIGLGLFAALAAIEAGCWLWPATGTLDNPWYLLNRSGGGRSRSELNRLPYARPAHFKWTGLSRGDLSTMYGTPDPAARTITFRTDHQGFHNERDISQAEIAFIGDSFTEAGYLPEKETFVQRVAEKLNCSVRNLGRSGYAPPHESVVLRRYALPCHPKVIVWQIAESNDLTESVKYNQWALQGMPKYEPEPYSRTTSWKSRSPTHLLFESFRQAKKCPLQGHFVDKNRQSHLVQFWLNFAQDHSVPGHEGWPLIADALRLGQQSVAVATPPAQLVVVLIPTKQRVLEKQIEWEPWSVPYAKAGLERRPSHTMSAALSQLCQELGIPFLDLTTALQSAASQGELVYLPLDTHLSPLGHEIVGDAIAELLRQLPGHPLAKP